MNTERLTAPAARPTHVTGSGRSAPASNRPTSSRSISCDPRRARRRPGRTPGSARPGGRRDPLRVTDVGLAHLQEPATTRQQPQRRVHELPGQRVQHDIHARTVGGGQERAPELQVARTGDAARRPAPARAGRPTWTGSPSRTPRRPGAAPAGPRPCPHHRRPRAPAPTRPPADHPDPPARSTRSGTPPAPTPPARTTTRRESGASTRASVTAIGPNAPGHQAEHPVAGQRSR